MVLNKIGLTVYVNPSYCGEAGSTTGAINLEEAEWNNVMATNLRGPWLMTKAVARRMRSAKRKGSIITITSIAGLSRSLLPLGIAYGTSKTAANQRIWLWSPEISTSE